MLSFDLAAIPGATCVAGQFSYTQKLILYTMTPPVCLAALITPLLVVIMLGWFRKKRSSKGMLHSVLGWFRQKRSHIGTLKEDKEEEDEHPKYQAVYANTWQYGNPAHPTPAYPPTLNPQP